ncbi:serine/threonine protein kinase [Chloroflexota bacterium]
MNEQVIGRYEIIEELGKGGMATVFLAKDPKFDREVAIKVLPRQFLHDEKFLARFKREAKTITQLEHKAIVPVYEHGEYEGQPYLVMRYMSGGVIEGSNARREIGNRRGYQNFLTRGRGIGGVA